MYIYLVALPTLLYGWEVCAIGERDKSRIMSAEVKFMGKRAKYKRQDYKNSEDILSEFKINHFEGKMKYYFNKRYKTCSVN
jgi:hypothetical protein